ncbi:MAG: NAD(P)H-dependent oxidoreductase [Acidobacteriota bacterium]|nr:NAD(P)H-dependent oxidoreductase [Acidobacteriota bacterium]
MRVLAISGSLRIASSTSQLVRLAAQVAPDGVEFAFYDALGELPHFTPDLDTDNPPASVQQLRDAIASADALLICTPEYAHGMPGSLKNLLDWLVSWPGFVGKRIGAMSASPSADGGNYAHEWLMQTVTVMSADVVKEASIVVPFVKKRLASNDDSLRDDLRNAVAALAR